MVWRLLEKVKTFLKEQSIKAEKDNVLVAAIHEIMVEDLGWKPKKIGFGSDSHELEYTKATSPFHELEIKATRFGEKLYLEFEGEVKKGGAFGEVFESIFDIDLDKEYKLKTELNLSDYVTDELEVINEERLSQLLKNFIGLLESKVKK
ncbi:MAG: hypothetical protein NZ809_02145 [Thermodesulfovibrio sp.]|nr:hypothetical protein [Thermodesulfovibrio sp.]